MINDNENGLNEIDFDGPESYEEPRQEDDFVQQETITDDEDSISTIELFLINGGIQDIHNIKFEENGILQNRDWNDLDAEEQLNILNSLRAKERVSPEIDLSDSEIELLNQIRSSGQTPEDFVRNIARSRDDRDEYYDLNQLSDEELYAVDLFSRFPDLSDEEVQQTIDNAKQNEALYQKQIASIRESAIQRQQEEQEQYNQARQQEQQDFSNSILQNISNLSEFGNIEVSMDVDDMEDLAQFILPGDNEISAFAQALNDPKNIVKAAWFLQNSDRIMSDLQDYIVEQVRAARQDGYNRAMREKSNPSNSKVVRKPTTTNKHDSVTTLADINI